MLGRLIFGLVGWFAQISQHTNNRLLSRFLDWDGLSAATRLQVRDLAPLNQTSNALWNLKLLRLYPNLLA